MVPEPERQQEHQNVQHIGIKNGCSIEKQAACKNVRQLAECPSAVKIVVVPEEDNPAQRIQKVYHQYPPDHLEIKVPPDGLNYFSDGHKLRYF